MKPLNIVIVEDEAPAAERLIKMLKEYDPAMQVQARLDTVQSAVDWFSQHGSPDLVFLDIELGDGRSFEIFSRIQINSYIIFVTAFNEYAIQAFKYNSVDYLLKPLKKNELHYALDKFRNMSGASQPTVDLAALLDNLQPKGNKVYKNRFLVKKGTRYFSIEAKEVAHVYTRDRVHFIKTKDGTDYIIDNNLDELEEQLSPDHFFRVNRQFIVNYDTIQEVHAWFDGKLKIMVKPTPFEDIVISRLKAGDFKEWLNK
ncbi:LytTR family DNA-binding domain-containing protein [Flavihumibacter rivuli]|uniref:LytR/AlgR family response regulator transcription factor n=1 Tax=Flavihumibacter rivuli TaxID=2838156 RepID=UPI001BDF271D|nr:LytTR family DNA-binding domain-containing protein [Flavihumibacter rivuli]ULQ55944.1 LytTR family DNA-binding domain-containing protein [Flavihumibacter rivuli]